MKKYTYILLPVIFLLTSCYIYKPYSEKSEEDLSKQQNNLLMTPKSIRVENSSDKAVEKNKQAQGGMSQEESEAQKRKEKEMERQKLENEKGNESQNKFSSDPESKSKSGGKVTKTSEEPKVREIGIKGKLQPNKYYKITALGNQYKIQVDKWEGDTLVSHKIRQPKKQFKFHKNDIEEEMILERRFSKPFSDLFTVGAYASGAAILLLLIL